MSRRIIWALLAEHDRDEVADFIARDSRKAAVRFLEAVEKACSRLTDFPEIGGLWESPSPRLAGIRVWPIPKFENYLLFYRLTEQSIEIIRLLHGARDLETQLRK